MNAKVWYLAAGKKKVGPISKNRVLKRVASGKVPEDALAWKEGMDEWLPLDAISELTVAWEEDPGVDTAQVQPDESGSSDSEPEAEAGAEPEPEAKPKTKTKTKTKSGRKKRSRSTGKVKTQSAKIDDTSSSAASQPQHSAAGSFSPLHRIEREDVWRGFGLGLARSRIVLTLAVFGGSALIGGVLLGLGALAAKAHLLLMLPFVLAAAVASYVLGCAGLGALSYSSRCQLEERTPPTVKEALLFAREHLASLTVTPFLLSIAWLAPLLALALLTLLVKVPYLGPLATGLLFGVHIALSAATLFLVLTAGVGSIYTPVIVAFEETGIKSTFHVLLEFVKRSTARLVLWGWKPNLAMLPFSGLVIGVGALILGPALMFLFGAAGGPQLAHYLSSGGATDPPISGLSVGMIPLAMWVVLFVSAVASVLASVQNAMLSVLYLGGREGNDELISRDSYREQKSLAGQGA